MIDDVGWPDVANSAALHGKQAIRSYWHAQFATADPHGDPLTSSRRATTSSSPSISASPTSKADRPRYRRWCFRYTFGGDLVRRMVLFTDRDAAITELEGRAPDLPARDVPNDETERAPPRGNRSGTGRSAGTRPPGCALQNR
jgi:hypothetical protein